MRLSCGNTLKWPGELAPLGAGQIKRFRSSAAVHGQERDESRLTPGGCPRYGHLSRKSNCGIHSRHHGGWPLGEAIHY
jgi:hypothetical protein